MMKYSFLMAVSFGLIALSLTSPVLASARAPLPAEDQKRIGSVVNGINRDDYLRDLEILTGERDVPDHLANGAEKRIRDRFRAEYIGMARAYITDRINKMGLSNVVREDIDMNAKFSRPRVGRALNLYVDIPGRLNKARKSKEVVIISGHYDTRGPGVPGANDNGTAVAALLNILEQMVRSGFEPDYSVRFAFFDVEELGGARLNGSGTHHDNMVARGETLRLLVNIDMIGDNPAGTRNILYDHSDQHENALASLFSDVNERYALDFEVGTWGPYRSDQAVFADEGKPAISVFEHAHKEPGVETGRYHPENHSPRDTIASINVDYAVEMTKFIGALSLESSRDESVWNTPAREQARIERTRGFFDFFSSMVGSWFRKRPRTCKSLMG